MALDKWQLAAGSILVVLVGGFVWFSGNYMDHSPGIAEPVEPSALHLTAMACVAATEAIRPQLKSPSTANFPDCAWEASEYRVTANPERTRFGVQGYVDSQNSFGAMMRSRFVVILRKDPASPLPNFTVEKAALE